MLHFVSTFPPMACGIGSYTSYVTEALPRATWKVTAFRPNQYSPGIPPDIGRVGVSYDLILGDARTLSVSGGDTMWFQHAFGMWGRRTEPLRDLIMKAKRSGARTICTFHTIHFESTDTESGLTFAEEELASVLLGLLDGCTVFSDGAYRALSRAFPECQRKIRVLRHGVHRYPVASRDTARRKVLAYFRDKKFFAEGRESQERDLTSALTSPDTVLLGNCGFIGADKDPLSLYELGNRIRRECPDRRVICLYIGAIQDRRDRKTADSMELLKELRDIHDGRDNLFFEDYLPEEIFPLVFRSLDFCVFWYRNATQSGRMAHAQGAGASVIGRRIEGLGETVDAAKLPSAVSMEDLTEKVVRLIHNPGLRQETERLSQEYASQFSFEKQAAKHLSVVEAIEKGCELPLLDRAEPDVSFILPKLAVASSRGLEGYRGHDVAFLNVSDCEDVFPRPTIYRRIPLRDGTPVPPAALREAIEWIRQMRGRQVVVVFCRYGMGRSASIVIAYLCCLGFDYRDAVKLVSVRRPGSTPLPQLRESIQDAFRFGRMTQGDSADLSYVPSDWVSPTESRGGCTQFGIGNRQE